MDFQLALAAYLLPQCRSSVAQEFEQGVFVVQRHQFWIFGRFSHLLRHRTNRHGAHLGLGVEHHGLGSSPSNPRLERRFKSESVPYSCIYYLSCPYRCNILLTSPKVVNNIPHPGTAIRTSDIAQVLDKNVKLSSPPSANRRTWPTKL